jgi:ubiquinone/menaquinone biosynthesis C-methylase UbiE
MQKVWREEDYYKEAKKGSLDTKHPGMKLLLKLARKDKSILDLGCGEGTRLNFLGRYKSQLFGVDVSETAIRIAKKQYPEIMFVRANMGDLPFKEDSIDLVYSAYVLEHLENVTKCLNEAIRVSKKDIVIICPNYGAPNRASPNFKGSRVLKMIKGFINDFKYSDVDKWNKVTPLYEDIGNYHIDSDTLVEPYIKSLYDFFKKSGLKVVYLNTCWNYERKDAHFHQKVFRKLARVKLKPFIYWGPHAVIHAVKN